MEVKGTSGKKLKMSPTTTPLFSPENWKRILLTLSPEDFWTAINTSPEWNQLMTPKKNDVLFPKIVPSLVGYLPRETILACRRLSQDVNNKTDELLSNDNDFEETLTGGTKITKFMSMMESRPFPERNPFIGRSVLTRNLDGRTEEESTRRVQAVRQVLTRYGHHVRRFQFTERPLHPERLESYLSLFSLLPNLKRLDVFDCALWEMDYYEPEYPIPKFPKLNKLEELRLINLDVLAKTCCSTAFSLVFINEYGPQLKALALDYQFFYRFECYSRSFDSLAPNLKQFEMTTSDICALKKLAVTKWKLEVLELSGVCGMESVPELIAAVNNFATTLLNLNLSWYPGEELNPAEKPSNEQFVELSKLKTLSLRFDNLAVDWIWEFLKRVVA